MRTYRCRLSYTTIEGGMTRRIFTMQARKQTTLTACVIGGDHRGTLPAIAMNVADLGIARAHDKSSSSTMIAST